MSMQNYTIKNSHKKALYTLKFTVSVTVHPSVILRRDDTFELIFLRTNKFQNSFSPHLACNITISLGPVLQGGPKN